jgi:multidrug resistance efflux pump
VTVAKTAAATGYVPRKSRREPVEVAEPPRPDRTLGTLISIRSQRVQRAEADCVRARRTCEEAKAAVHAAIAEVREAREQATRFWRDTMTAFKQMCISSAELLRAKADYRRRRDHTDELRAAARQAVHRLRGARHDKLSTQQDLRLAQRACEKLSLWRDELLANQPKE